MAHYDEQRRKFENHPKPYFVKRKTRANDTRQPLSERTDQLEDHYDKLHPIIVD